MLKAITFLLVIALCITSCGRAVDCTVITDEPLRQLDIEAATFDSMPAWVTQNYGLEPSEIESGDYSARLTSDKDAHYVIWRTEGRTYRAYFNEDYALRHVAVELSDRPLIEEFVGCIGNPDFYHAFHTYGQLHVQLMYLSEGMMMEASDGLWFNTPVTRINDANIGRIFFVAPGSREQVYSDVHPSMSAEIVENNLTSMKPWPDSWEEIVVEQP